MSPRMQQMLDIAQTIPSLTTSLHALSPSRAVQSSRYADIIVPHNGPKNGVAIDLLVQHISTEIYKRGASLKRSQSKESSLLLAQAASPRASPKASPKASPRSSPNGTVLSSTEEGQAKE
jgi:hypothetical protein